MEEAGDENTLVHDEDFVCTIYHYGFVDGLDLSADVLDSLLKLWHLDYYNTVFRLPCYSYYNKRLSLLNASYVLNALLGPLKFNKRPRRLLDHLR